MLVNNKTEPRMPEAPKTPIVIFFLIEILMGITGFIFWWNNDNNILFLAILAWFALGIIILVNCTYGDVDAFYAEIIKNDWTGRLRIVFAGINFRWPWEHPAREGGHEESEKIKFDLRVESSREVKETAVIKGGAFMQVKFLFTTRPNLTGNVAKNVLIFSHYEQKTIDDKAEAELWKYLSDWYRSKELTDVRGKSKEEITLEVFGPNTMGLAAMEEFEKLHGTEVVFILKDSDPDETTLKNLSQLAKATIMVEQKRKIKKVTKNEETADRMLMLMNFPENVTYDENEVNLRVDAPDLKNLQNLSLLGGEGLLGSKKKRTKKQSASH